MTQTTPPPFQPSPENPKAATKAAKAYAKATRPWYKKKRWIALIAIVALIAIAVASGGGSSDGPKKVGGSKDSSASDTDTNTAGSKGNPIAIGETVKLEGTQYTVKSAKMTASVGDSFTKEKADGIFVIIALTIENKKNETKTFSSSAANFVARNGKKYDADTDASLSLIGNDEDPLIFEDMQPDLPKTGQLVFDVPKGVAKGGLLEVSDLFGRGNAYIDLGLK